VSAGGAVAIEASGLTKRFGKTVAVDQLSFTVAPGRVTGFLGPNGSGKSTTLRLLLQLDRADAGEARFAGRRYRELRDPMRVVGSLLDAGHLHPSRSARNHLRVLATAARVDRRRVDEVLGMVGLSDVAGEPAGNFSLGMRQRLGLAGALLGDPPVLVLDEPANGLDPEGIQWIRTFLRYLAGQGRTIFVSSHLLAEMAQMAEDLVVIGRGRLIAQATVEEFVQRFTAAWVRVRSPEMARLSEALRAAGATVSSVDGDADALRVEGIDAARAGDVAFAAGVPLHELVDERASLEEAFLEVTRDALQFKAGGS